jgi:aspartate carbamoyltransferase catalytic subunit
VTRSLHSIAQLSPQDLRELLSQSLTNLSSDRTPASQTSPLQSRTISLLFYENSTRTRLSFESAIRALGGMPQSLAISQSSVQKGETLSDTAMNLLALGACGFILRHPSPGSSRQLADALKNHPVPVINAGDGFHAHPTQALLDAATLLHHWGLSAQAELPLRGKTILILGDIRHSRVARSNLELLPRLGAQVLISGPGSLLPSVRELAEFPSIKSVSFPDQILREVDAVMVLRLQLERQETGFIPSQAEYRHFWGLTRDRAQTLKKDALILHPGPANPGVEIDPEVMACSQSKILDQVKIGIATRKAVLAWAWGGIA